MKNFENRSTFGKLMDKGRVTCFFDSTGRNVKYRLSIRAHGKSWKVMQFRKFRILYRMLGQIVRVSSLPIPNKRTDA